VMLQWGRRTAGLSIEIAAKKAKVKPEQLASWEAGNDYPTIAQMERLAEVYKPAAGGLLSACAAA
jgi:Helix-turn-helix.